MDIEEEMTDYRSGIERRRTPRLPEAGRRKTDYHKSRFIPSANGFLFIAFATVLLFILLII